jgi:plasmid stability protein
MTLKIELPDDQQAALRAKARARGVSTEEYAREVLERDLEAPASRRPPISELIREIWRDIPEDVRAKLPRDGASQVDHYVYGLPKRDE